MDQLTAMLKIAMRKKRLRGLLVGMLMEASVNAATPFTLPSEDRILPSSLELERRTQPWCPGDCAVLVPFVASYRNGTERLVFVGARHPGQLPGPRSDVFIARAKRDQQLWVILLFPIPPVAVGLLAWVVKPPRPS
jgi:hypothetical protein